MIPATNSEARKHYESLLKTIGVHLSAHNNVIAFASEPDRPIVKLKGPDGVLPFYGSLAEHRNFLEAYSLALSDLEKRTPYTPTTHGEWTGD